MIEVLVANRLTSPAPLVRVGDWAAPGRWRRSSASSRTCSTTTVWPGLDAIAPKLEQIAGTIARRRSPSSGSTCRGCTGHDQHVRSWAYPSEDQDEQYPVISYGHPKDRRVDLKQVRPGSRCRRRRHPVHARVFGGGVAEVSQVVGAMKNLRGMAGERKFLMVADSKLVSYTNVTALLAAGVDFIAPVPAAQVKDEVYAALDLTQAQPVDWVPERDTGKPAGEREVYRVLEDVHILAGPRKRDPVHRLRRVLVHSTAVAAGQRRAARSAWPGPGKRWTSSPARQAASTTRPGRRSRPGRSHCSQAPRHRLPALDHHHRRARHPALAGTSTKRLNAEAASTAGTRC
ncbi:hypothetical protein SAZ11_60915 [Streptomyces sp. FXJ1.4098]|nr:hypothetical protein [Streptomyces sp. FXJ1.4098]